MPLSSPAATLRARAARLSRVHGPDHPDARAAWAEAYGEQFAEYAERVATRAPRFNADQLARIASVLDAGSDSRAGAA